MRKWLAILPHPYTAPDRRAGFRYALSILQAKLSLTQVLDRPVVGRVFFDDVFRHNLDLGRPDPVLAGPGKRLRGELRRGWPIGAKIVAPSSACSFGSGKPAGLPNRTFVSATPPGHRVSR